MANSKARCRDEEKQGRRRVNTSGTFAYCRSQPPLEAEIEDGGYGDRFTITT